VSSPSYRTVRIAQPREVPEPFRFEDSDLILPFTVLWLVSILRVLGGIFRHESFGMEPTLALFAALFLPYLLLARRV
jgi:hypothetical protein